jgi:hypothetical protein
MLFLGKAVGNAVVVGEVDLTLAVRVHIGPVAVRLH